MRFVVALLMSVTVTVQGWDNHNHENDDDDDHDIVHDDNHGIMVKIMIMFLFGGCKY